MIGTDPYTAGGYQVLKVETHLHTVHSDGQHGVAAMLQACQTAGYDAVALTDHNTLSGVHEAEVAAERLGLVLVPGVEVTTFRGHAIALGVGHVPEWRSLEATGMDALAADVHAQGGLLCVAHPAALGSPICSGCSWSWPIQPASVDLWEVFSAPRPGTEIPAELWRRLLAAGGRAAPVAAGDVHSISAAARLKTATYVHATERSPAGVLDALRQGRVFASSGPRVDFWLEDAAGNIALAGSRVRPGDWIPRVAAPAQIREIEVADRGRCVYAERRNGAQRLEAVSAAIWIDSSH